jgi:hypothetical protein
VQRDRILDAAEVYDRVIIVGRSIKPGLDGGIAMAGWLPGCWYCQMWRRMALPRARAMCSRGRFAEWSVFGEFLTGLVDVFV